jgi:hypothetical protein
VTSVLDDLYDRLAAIAKVSRFEQFRQMSQRHIFSAIVAYLNHQRRTDTINTLEGIAKNGARVSRGLMKLGQRGSDGLMPYLDRLAWDMTLSDGESIGAVWRGIANLIDAARQAKAKLKGDHNAKGEAHDLVRCLEEAAVLCGGSFSYTTRGPTGSLLEAVRVLAPHLPEGFFPGNATSYQHDLAKGRKSARRHPVNFETLRAPMPMSRGFFHLAHTGKIVGWTPAGTLDEAKAAIKTGSLYVHANTRAF